MKTALIVLLVLVIVLILTFFRSSYYLKMRLDWLKEDLEKLPNTNESLDLIAEISQLVSGDFNQQQKVKARDLISRSSNFLMKNVPCYSENREIPSWEERNDPTFKCERCNEKRHCIFHWWPCQPIQVGFFLNLKFQPNRLFVINILFQAQYLYGNQTQIYHLHWFLHFQLFAYFLSVFLLLQPDYF